MTTLFFAALMLALVTWGPTLLTYRRRRSRGEPVSIPQLATALSVELAAVVIAVLVVEGLGVPNGGAYVLATALLAGAIGAHVYSQMRPK